MNSHCSCVQSCASKHEQRAARFDQLCIALTQGPSQARLSTHCLHQPSMVAKQQTILGSFQKGHRAAKPDLPAAEIPCDAAPEVLSTYYTTQLGSTFSHYEDELNKKRKKRPAPARAYGTRQNNSPGKADSPEFASHKRLRSDGDAEGQRYLEYLRQLVSKDAALSEMDQQRLIAIMRCHAFHSSKDMSVMAFRLIQQLADLHPITASTTDMTGRPVVVIPEASSFVDSLDQRSKPWTFVGSKMQGNVMQHPDSELPRQSVLVFIEIWRYAADQAEQMAGTRQEGMGDIENSYRNFGEFWLLKLVLSELHRDLRHRLSVYTKCTMAADKQDCLLVNSQLWRMLENFDCNMSELVRLLMRIIGASAAPEDAQQEANQESPACIARKSYSRAFQALDADASGLSEIQTADVTSDGAAAHHEEGTADMPVEAEMFSVAELTEMARMMLNMILELYGTAEQAGLFQPQRKIVSRGLQFQTKYTRIKLDHDMVDGLVGAKEVLKLVPEKAVFLSALHPRDCLRLLGVAVASRLGDTSKYPMLSEYKAMYNGSKDHSTYLEVDPVSILEGLMDIPQHQGRLLHKEGSLDALAVVAAMTVQSALQLGQTGSVFKMETVLKFFKAQARGDFKHYVSNDSWAMLAGAACSANLIASH